MVYPTTTNYVSQVNPMNSEARRTTQRSLRMPVSIESGLLAIAKERQMTFAAVVNQALREFLDRDRQSDELANLEKRIAGSLVRLMKDVANLRNDQHLALAFIDTLAQTYLLHTPPLPAEAVESASASASDRHGKYIRRVVSQLQGGEGLWAELVSEGVVSPTDE